MTEFTPFASLVGGVLIGLASALLLVGDGKIAGISGIVGGLLGSPPGDTAWRLTFLAGVLSGGVAMYALVPAAFAVEPTQALAVYALAGVLVGYGTRLGSGCTSGHGVCGVGRGSRRSIVATLTFMATGIATVFVARHVLGGLLG